jgi:riboflavin kinase / FMN adenylyltransferase
MGEGRIVSALGDVTADPSVVSIGFFDGVHRGHQTIIRRAVQQAAERDVRSAVVTFDRHPMEVIQPGSQPKLLMTLSRRAQSLAELDVDLVVVVPFTDELRHLSPEDFIDHVLVERLQAVRVVVGANFRFGHKAAGDVALLAEVGPSRGFEAEGVTLLELDGLVISSTEIRAAVERGDVEHAAQLLGRPHVVDGIVVRGDHRGAALGFPTANLQVSRRITVPARGVYAGMCRLPDGRSLPTATSVGVNPTFGGQELRVEAHLLEFDGDLYGSEVAIDFRHRLRDETRFETVEALVEQMRRDVDEARRLL